MWQVRPQGRGFTGIRACGRWSRVWPEESSSASHSRALMCLKTMATRGEELEVGFRIFRQPMERRTEAQLLTLLHCCVVLLLSSLTLLRYCVVLELLTLLCYSLVHELLALLCCATPQFLTLLHCSLIHDLLELLHCVAPQLLTLLHCDIVLLCSSLTL